MKFQKLNINTMPLNKWQIFKWKNIILDDSQFHKEKKILLGNLSVRAKEDFSLLNEIKIDYHYSSSFQDKIYTANKDNETITEINLENLSIKQMNSNLLPEYFWEKTTCFHNLKNHTYEVFDNENNLLNSFNIEYPINFKCVESGVLLWNNEQKENNWIECRNPANSQVKWKINLKWKFVRIEIYKNRIIVEYNSFEKTRTDKGYEGQRDWFNPERFTIAFDISNGKQIWKKEFVFSQIDKENEIVLGANGFIYEVDLYSGKMINTVKVSPENNLGYYPHFADSNSYYYTLHNGRFGKINKLDGNIEWEFQFVDNWNSNREISDWILLKNGNLLLRTLPNHKNGDITCIFNPSENIEYSEIVR